MKPLNIQSSAIFIILLLVSVQVFGSTYKKGTTAGSFLKLEVGARAAALGGSYVGLANDATASYWNPAGLFIRKGFNLSFQNSQLYAGLHQTFFATSYSITPEFSLGVFVNYLNIGTFEETTIQNPDGTGEIFTAKDMAVGLAFCSQLTDHVSIGVTAKYVQERIWYESASNVAFDLGTLYRFSDIGLSVGMLLSNLGPSMSMDQGPQLTFRKQKPDNFPGSPDVESQLKTRTFPLPMCFTLGIAMELVGRSSPFLKNERNRILLVASSNDAIDAPFRSNFGLEYAWNRTLLFRVGYRWNYDAARESFGMGLDLFPLLGKNIAFDYTWIDYRDLDSISMWSFSIGF